MSFSRPSESTMRYLHISIDGSWLRKLCARDKVFASRTVNPDKGVRLDFNRLNQLLLTHIHQFDNHVKLGKLVLATSVFSLPDEFESWPNQYPFASSEAVRVIKSDVRSRELFVESAVKAGYMKKHTVSPKMKPWILKECIKQTYKEKQVDTTFTSNFEANAKSNPEDYHCLITGDVDALPSLDAVYPAYTRNVFLATTDVGSHTSAYALRTFKLDIPTLYLERHVADIIQGDFVYTCVRCDKVFYRNGKPVPQNEPPCCPSCFHEHQNNTRKAA